MSQIGNKKNDKNKKDMKKEEPKCKKHECFRVIIMCENFLGDSWQGIARKEEEVKNLANDSEKIDSDVEGILKEYFNNDDNVGEGSVKLKCVMKKVVTEKIERREEINKRIA